MGKKPWSDRDPYPFQGDGDTDGDDNGAFKSPGPGEEGSQKPSGDGATDNMDDL